jgi:hypothetical protein
MLHSCNCSSWCAWFSGSCLALYWFAMLPTGNAALAIAFVAGAQFVRLPVTAYSCSVAALVDFVEVLLSTGVRLPTAILLLRLLGMLPTADSVALAMLIFRLSFGEGCCLQLSVLRLPSCNPQCGVVMLPTGNAALAIDLICVDWISFYCQSW